MLRSTFIEMAERFGEEFRNHMVIVKDMAGRTLYKGKAINIDRRILDDNVLVCASTEGKAIVYEVKPWGGR